MDAFSYLVFQYFDTASKNKEFRFSEDSTFNGCMNRHFLEPSIFIAIFYFLHHVQRAIYGIGDY